MNIISAEWMPEDPPIIKVTVLEADKDGNPYEQELFVPDDMMNRDRRLLDEWVQTGKTITGALPPSRAAPAEEPEPAKAKKK